MKRLLFIIFGWLFLTIHCSHSYGVIYDEDAITISIGKENYQERVYCSQLFDSVKYIILENSDKCLIGVISKVVFYKNRFYELDVQQMILFAFSATIRHLKPMCTPSKTIRFLCNTG